MQFRKIAAVAGSALMAGMTLAGAALAASVADVGHIGDTVTATDFPLFVVGADAKPADVAGAINVAAYLAGKSETKATAATSGLETVTQGAKIDTPGNALEPWESVQSVKSVLTKSDLDILADGTFLTATGGTYTYKQYLYPSTDSNLAVAGTPAQLKFERATTGSQTTTPDIWFKSTGNEEVYTYKLSFGTAIPLSSAIDSTTLKAILQGQNLNIMGKDYVISDATWIGGNTAAAYISDMTLLGGKNVVLMNHIAGVADATEKVITIDEKEYTIKFKGVTAASSTVNKASFSIEEGGTTTDFSIQSGGTGTFKGLTVGVISVGSTSVAGGTEELKVVLGADKIKIYSSGTVTKGTTTMPELNSGITSTQAAGLSVIRMTWTPTSTNWLAKGESLEDPFIGAFNLKFSGVTPAFDNTENRQTISFSRSGDFLYLTYKNAGGVEKNTNIIAYDTTNCPGITTATGSHVTGYCFGAVSMGSASTNDNNYRDVAFDEAANISAYEGDYFVIQKNGFSHIMQFTSFSPATSELSFTDESGNSLSTSNTTSGAYNTADLIVDGITYKAVVIDETKKIVQIDLNGDGYMGAATAASAYANANAQIGAQYSYLAPEKITSGQGGLYFYKGNQTVTIPTATPGYADLGFHGIRLSNVTTTMSVSAYGYSDADWSVASPSSWSASTTTIPITPAASAWTDWTNYTVNYIDFGVRCRNNTAAAHQYECEVALGGTTGPQTSSTGLILVEEALQGTTTHNWLYFPVTHDSTYKLAMNTPVSDDSNFVTANAVIQGTSTENRMMTKYGTLVEWKSTQLGGGLTAKYPDLYTYGNVYFLAPEGTITSTGGSEAGTYEAVLHPQVTADVAKLDTEVTDADKTGKDLIVVGGPAVNSIAADLMGKTYPAYGAASGIPENAGLVKVFKDKFATGKTAILIAGWEAADTDLATRLVQTGKLADKTDAAVQVSGTVASPTISAYTEAAAEGEAEAEAEAEGE